MMALGGTLARLLGRAGRKALLRKDLPRSAVVHDSLDDLTYGNMLEDSPKFRRQTVESPPRIPRQAVEVPDAPDFTTASQEEIAAYQKAARKAQKAREEAPEYKAWGDLTADVYRSLHTHDLPEVVDAVDPDVALHPRVMQKLIVQEDHSIARNITRDDPIASAIATMSMMGKLKDVLTEDLQTQVEEQENLREEREHAQQAQEKLEDLRGEAKAHKNTSGQVPQELVDQIKQAIGEREGALDAASQIAANPAPISAEAMQGLAEAAQAGAEGAEAASALPSFGHGLGEGEPTYTSPEQALSIAERWANDPDLRKMAELFGRLDRDIRFKRSKRVVGGNDEIVDIRFGDNLQRTIPAELALLSDPDLEDDFYARYASQELLEFSTVGEEHAGRGPILIVLDGSGSMGGERNIWSRAVAMCLLHIARLEKRDFGLIEFSGGTQIAEWFFRAKEAMPGDKVLDMAAHFFGGGTAPITGMTRASEIMRQSPPFSKADLVLVGDGEAGFGDEDKRLRDSLHAMGVRIFAIGIGGSFRYLQSYTEPEGYLVNVADFDLTDPNAATAELATHIS